MDSSKDLPNLERQDSLLRSVYRFRLRGIALSNLQPYAAGYEVEIRRDDVKEMDRLLYKLTVILEKGYSLYLRQQSVPMARIPAGHYVFVQGLHETHHSSLPLLIDRAYREIEEEKFNKLDGETV